MIAKESCVCKVDQLHPPVAQSIVSCNQNVLQLQIHVCDAPIMECGDSGHELSKDDHRGVETKDVEPFLLSFVCESGVEFLPPDQQTLALYVSEAAQRNAMTLSCRHGRWGRGGRGL